MSSNVEKDIYSATKNYVEVTFSKKRPPLDFEFNELQKIQSGLRQQFNRAALLDGPSGDGFLVEGTGNANEIRIRQGLLFQNGQNLYLVDDLIIDTLTTPGGSDRTDVVYAEWHMSEVDSGDDPALIDSVNVGLETAVRQRMNVSIYVAEGGFVPTPVSGYTQYRLAVLNRLDGIALVDNTQISDYRIISGLNYVSAGGKLYHTTAFNYSFEGVSGLVGGSTFNLPNSLGSIGSNEVRYMYISDAEVLTVAASLPTTYHVPIARLTSNNTEITEILDLRRFSPRATAGEGGAQTTLTVTALVSINQYELVRVTGVNTVSLADASAEGTMPTWGIALDDASSGQSLRVLTTGLIENDLWSFTAGNQLYVSETSGAITPTAPIALGSVIQKVGVALTPTLVYFAPDLTYDVNGGVSSHAQNTDIGTTGDSFTLRLGQGNMSSPSGFYVDPGLGANVGVRYTGSYWEFSNDGTTWSPLGASDSAFRYDTVGDGTSTLFVLPQAYTVGGQHLLIFAGSTLMVPGIDYSETSATQITFGAAPLNGEALAFVVPSTGNLVLDNTLTPAFDNFTANGIDSFVTLSNAAVAPSVIVSINGVILTPLTDYSVAGNTVTFTTLPPALDKITAFYSYI